MNDEPQHPQGGDDGAHSDGGSRGGDRPAEQILAGHLTPLQPPLTEDDRDRLLEAGLVHPDELVATESAIVGASGRHWAYRGSRWAAIYRDGRPVLVSERDAWDEPLTPAQRAERDFAIAIQVIEFLGGHAFADDDILELRSRPPWSRSFSEAERDQAERAGDRTKGCTTDE